MRSLSEGGACLGGFDLLLRIGRKVQKGHVLLLVGVRVDHVYSMSDVGP